MSLTDCPMCHNPVAPEQGEAATSCSHCGADLSRWRPKPSAPLPRRLEKEPPPTSFPKQAAVFSVIAPFVAFVSGALVQPQLQGNRLGSIILGVTCIFLVVSGFVLGFAALVASRRFSREGILARAVTGMCLNGLLLACILIAVTALLINSEKAKARERQPTAETPR